MPRPTTKQDLISSANEQFDKLWKLIDTFPEPEILTFNFDLSDPKLKEAHWKRDNNLRDVLTHLYEWHNLLLNWVKSNQSGDNKPFLPEPYNWRTYGDMNVMFFSRHQSTTYKDAAEMLKKSHSAVIELIEKFSNDELFSKNVFPWVGGSTLGSYCVSATSSHYVWAIKKIKAHIKTL